MAWMVGAMHFGDFPRFRGDTASKGGIVLYDRGDFSFLKKALTYWWSWWALHRTKRRSRMFTVR